MPSSPQAEAASTTASAPSQPRRGPAAAAERVPGAPTRVCTPMCRPSLAHEAVHHRQAHSRTAARELGSEEGIEDAAAACPGRCRSHRPAPASSTQFPCGANLATGLATPAALCRMDPDPNAPGTPDGVTRVDAQVEQQLLELNCVGIDLRQQRIVRPARRSSPTYGKVGRSNPIRLVHQRRAAPARAAPGLARANASICAIRSRARSVASRAWPSWRTRRGRRRASAALLRDHQVAEDARAGFVEVVRDAAGELADRLHLLRLAQLPPSCARSASRRRSVMSRPMCQHMRLTTVRERDRRGPRC